MLNIGTFSQFPFCVSIVSLTVGFSPREFSLVSCSLPLFSSSVRVCGLVFDLVECSLMWFLPRFVHVSGLPLMVGKGSGQVSENLGLLAFVEISSICHSRVTTNIFL